MEIAIRAEGLTKRYKETQALRGLDLQVPAGSVLGVMGPNGAGKTTTVRILATLMAPDSGTAEVAGYDVMKQRAEVRRKIGLTGQYAALDEKLTGRENLVLVAILHGMARRKAREKASDLLERCGLTEAGDRVVRTYSGGMRRRLDLAASLIGDPAVLFLDEPTTGIDPVNRAGLWRLIREQAASGVTVLLTTQYLEEADQLADRLVVIDSGQVIAEGTPDELKRKVGAERLEVAPTSPDDGERMRSVLGSVTGELILRADDETTVSIPLTRGVGEIAEFAALLAENNIEIAKFSVVRPSLDDVFMALTGSVDKGSVTP